MFTDRNRLRQLFVFVRLAISSLCFKYPSKLDIPPISIIFIITLFATKSQNNYYGVVQENG